MTGMLLPKPEQLVDMVGHAAAVKLAMDGAFDEKIAEFKAATAALAQTEEIVKTLKEAKKIRVDADNYARDVRAECEKEIAKAAETLNSVVSREAIVGSREGAVSRRETAIEARSNGLDKREADILNAQNTRETELTLRETALAKNQKEYNEARAKLTADIANFNQRLESLKA